MTCLGVGDPDGIAGAVRFPERDEALARAEEAGVDRGPLRCARLVVKEDLTDLADLVAAAVQQLRADELSDVRAGDHALSLGLACVALSPQKTL